MTPQPTSSLRKQKLKKLLGLPKKKLKKLARRIKETETSILLKQIYPYAVMVLVIFVLVLGSFAVFHYLPDYTDREKISNISESKTVYSDETVSFTGLDNLESLENISNLTFTDDDLGTYITDITKFIELIDPEAAPKDNKAFYKNIKVYQYGYADYADLSDFNGQVLYGTAHYYYNDDFSENPHNTAFTGYSNGVVFELRDVEYKSKNSKNYICTCIFDEGSIYYFRISEDHDDELSSEDFYSAIGALNLNVWNNSGEKALNISSAIFNDYQNGYLNSDSMEHYVSSVTDELENSEYRGFFTSLVNTALSYDEEYGTFTDYSFANVKFTEVLSSVADSAFTASKKILSGTDVIVTSESSFIVDNLRLAYIYDLYTGEIVGLGLI